MAESAFKQLLRSNTVDVLITGRKVIEVDSKASLIEAFEVCYIHILLVIKQW